MCLFDSNDSVLLFSENKYDDDDDDTLVLVILLARSLHVVFLFSSQCIHPICNLLCDVRYINFRLIVIMCTNRIDGPC